VRADRKFPKIKLAKEIGRSLLLNEESRAQTSSFLRSALHEIIILLRDTGMRPKKELFPMRIENLDWNDEVIFVPDSKTTTGRRFIPMGNRVLNLLIVRCAGRREGWVFSADSCRRSHHHQ
jgi:integrase